MASRHKINYFKIKQVLKFLKTKRNLESRNLKCILFGPHSNIFIVGGVPGRVAIYPLIRIEIRFIADCCCFGPDILQSVYILIFNLHHHRDFFCWVGTSHRSVLVDGKLFADMRPDICVVKNSFCRDCACMSLPNS